MLSRNGFHNPICIHLVVNMAFCVLTWLHLLRERLWDIIWHELLWNFADTAVAKNPELLYGTFYIKNLIDFSKASQLVPFFVEAGLRPKWDANETELILEKWSEISYDINRRNWRTFCFFIRSSGRQDALFTYLKDCWDR